MTLRDLVDKLGDRQPTEAEQAQIYKLMPPEQILIVNGVMISKPARKRRK